MRVWAVVFLGVSVAAIAGAGMLLAAFVERRTGQLFSQVGMVDPSTAGVPAAYACAAGIAVLLLVGLTVALSAFLVGVVGNVYPLHWLRKAWKDACDRKLAPAPALDALVAAVPRWSRVGYVLRVWQRAGMPPHRALARADAGMLLEGSAAREHQLVGLAQVIAGLLVLVGLAGNFLGLAHAIRGLPGLFEGAPSTLPAQTITRPPTDIGGGVTMTTAFSGETPAATPMPERVAGVSEGLSVVVVGSVLGVLGMVVLLGYAACVRAMLRTLVARETALLEGEIGPMLRPRDESQGDHELVLQALETVKASTTELAALGPRLERLVTDEAGKSRQALSAFETSVKTLTQVLQDERLSLTDLAASTGQIYSRIETLSQQLVRMTEGLETLHRSYGASQARYENYVRVATEQARADHEQVQSALQRLAADTTGHLSRVVGDSRTTLEEAGKRIVVALEKSFSEHDGLLHKDLVALTGVSERGMQAVAQASARSTEATLRETLQLAQGALERSCQALDATQHKYQHAYDRACAGFENAVRGLLQQTDAALGAMTQAASEPAARALTQAVAHLQQAASDLALQRQQLETAWGLHVPMAAQQAAKVHDDAQRMLVSAKTILDEQVRQLKAVPQALQDAARAADSRSRAETEALARAAQSLEETRQALTVLPDALGKGQRGRLSALLGRLGL